MNKPLLVAVLLGLATAVLGQPIRGDDVWRNFDTRRAQRAAGQDILEERRAAALVQLKARIRDVQVDFDGPLGTPKFVRSTTRFLTDAPPCFGDCPPLPPGMEAPVDPYRSDPYGALNNFLDQNAELFGHGAAILGSARVSREFVTAHNKVRTVVWHQELGGLPLFEARMIANFARDGRLVSVCSQLLPDPNRAMISSNLLIAPVHAVALAARQVDEVSADASEFVPSGDASGYERLQKFVGQPVIGEAKASLVWLPMDRRTLRLCWRVVLKGSRIQKLFQLLIDAETGEAMVRRCWSGGAAEATYLVFGKGSPTPLPAWSTPLTNQPAPVAQTNVTLIAFSTTASPSGWVNTNAGPFGLTNTTFGNNVDVHLDWTNAPPAYGTNPKTSALRLREAAFEKIFKI